MLDGGNFKANPNVAKEYAGKILTLSSKYQADADVPDNLKNFLGRTGYYNRCEHFVREAKGYSEHYETARAHYEDVRKRELLQSPDIVAPPGAVMCFASSNPAGYVAISLGDNKIMTTDLPVKDSIGVVTMEQITITLWNLKYLGWSS